MIHDDELDRTKGYLSQLRDLHPARIGQVVNGKRVIGTCWIYQGNYNVPMIKVEGEHDYREYQCPA